jgi:hypothetical protein
MKVCVGLYIQYCIIQRRRHLHNTVYRQVESTDKTEIRTYIKIISQKDMFKSLQDHELNYVINYINTRPVKAVG